MNTSCNSILAYACAVLTFVIHSLVSFTERHGIDATAVWLPITLIIPSSMLQSAFASHLRVIRCMMGISLLLIYSSLRNIQRVGRKLEC